MRPCVSELRRLWLEAADASDAVSQGYRMTLSDRAMDEREARADDTRQALLDHLLFEFGITKAEAERLGSVL